MSGKEIKLELGKEGAFALFSLLSSYAYDKKLAGLDDHEMKVLTEICHALDNELLERFRDEYKSFIKRKGSRKDAV